MSSNVVKVPPRRVAVHYKGLHGFVEYVPSVKKWRWIAKLVLNMHRQGEAASQAAAELELKKNLEVAAKSKNIRSID